MIMKPGKIVVYQDHIEIIDFHFISGGGKSPGVEALEWAKERLSDELRKMLILSDALTVLESNND